MIFVSHSKTDRKWAKAVVNRLKDRGYHPWLDEDQIPLGERFVLHIAEALRKANVFLVIDSPAAEASYWVGREVQMATRLRRARLLSRTICLQTKPNPTALSKWADWTGTLEQLLELRLDKGLHLRRMFTRDRHSVRIEGTNSEPVDSWLGFSDNLQMLDEWLMTDAKNLWIQGIGGSGKSELVRVWMTSVREIGYKMPLRLTFFYSLVWGPHDVEKLREWFSSISSQQGVVFVLDELSGMQEHDQRALLSHAQASGHRLIVTSHSGPSPQVAGHFAAHTMWPMDEDTAAMLLAKESGDLDVSRKLVRLVGGTPVGIGQLLAALKDGKLTPQDVLERLKQPSDSG
ncbi:MAG: toll/interleukin-1 receptor domain-containing protein [Candidatus Thiosymbion ectosymbiont of Robbea hypermnestra]|nr:toll/interleukin-1 receptor domain-containing protein [Candidatus Thiosymbion ectosymbiont of Robbea hypermnestra]